MDFSFFILCLSTYNLQVKICSILFILNNKILNTEIYMLLFFTPASLNEDE